MLMFCLFVVNTKESCKANEVIYAKVIRALGIAETHVAIQSLIRSIVRVNRSARLYPCHFSVDNSIFLKRRLFL